MISDSGRNRIAVRPPIHDGVHARMSLRIRSDARMMRHVPEISSWEQRQPAIRVASREEMLKVDPRPVPGEKLLTSPTEVRAPRLQKPVSPSPNAPLLIRVVRHPFPLEPTRNQKLSVEVRDHRGLRDRPPSRGPGRPFRELLQELHTLAGSFGRVDRGEDGENDRPFSRPRPWARARRGG